MCKDLPWLLLVQIITIYDIDCINGKVLNIRFWFFMYIEGWAIKLITHAIMYNYILQRICFSSQGQVDLHQILIMGH